MRVLITGAAGCIGHILGDYLLRNGYDILGLDNFTTSDPELIQSELKPKIERCDIVDPHAVNKIFQSYKPELVFHCAASYQDPDDWIGDINTNIAGTVNIVQSSLSSGVSMLINFQTTLCYGNTTDVPVRVDSPLNPRASYAISKVAAEEYLKQSELPYISLRLSTVIDDRLCIGAIPTFYSRLSSGKPVFCSNVRRDFLDKEDFVSFIKLILANKITPGVYNLGPGVGYSMLDICTLIANELGIDLPTPEVRDAGPDDVLDATISIEETLLTTQWQPTVPIKESIKKIVSHYRKVGVPKIYSHVRGGNS